MQHKPKHKTVPTLSRRRNRRGIVLIMVAGLVTMLAIIGSTFLLTSRVNLKEAEVVKIRVDLETATDAAVAMIRKELSKDLWGENDAVMLDDDGGSDEPYDISGLADPWLAPTVPLFLTLNSARWPRISDVTGELDILNGNDHQGDPISPDNMQAVILPSNEPVQVGFKADATGDGVSDSRWVRLPGHDDILVAIRIIDNCSMININTAYGLEDEDGDGQTDEDPPNRIDDDADGIIDEDGRFDGRLLSQVNLGSILSTDIITSLIRLQEERVLPDPSDSFRSSAIAYQDNIIRFIERPQYQGEPDPYVVLFDISDELELRNRYLINLFKRTTRFESVWKDHIAENFFKSTPFEAGELQDWIEKLGGLGTYPDRRHLLTAYSWDRTIRVAADENLLEDALRSTLSTDAPLTQVNVNAAVQTTQGLQKLFYALKLSGAFADNNEVVQYLLNLVDYADSDNDVTSNDGLTLLDESGTPLSVTPTLFGQEAQPFITEVYADVEFDNPLNNRFAIELYNPGPRSIQLDNYEFHFEKDNNPIAIDMHTLNPGEFYVLRSSASISVAAGASVDTKPFNIDEGDEIKLVRPRVAGSAVDVDVPLDVVRPDARFTDDIDWPNEAGETNVYIMQRADISGREAVNRIHMAGTLRLGESNEDANMNLTESGRQIILGDRSSGRLHNLAELGLVLRVGNTGSLYVSEEFDQSPDETIDLRFDLKSINGRKLLDQLSIYARSDDGLDNDDDNRDGIYTSLLPGDSSVDNTEEMRYPGRININTAPLAVIEALHPLMSPATDGHDIATAIVQYRRTVSPFDHLAALLDLPAMNPTTIPGGDLDLMYDLTPDGIIDDLEQKTVLFSKIANLVTVRSDTFTAYLHIAMVEDDPTSPTGTKVIASQRSIAILDRSICNDSISVALDRFRLPKVVALHPVPDPR